MRRAHGNRQRPGIAPPIPGDWWRAAPFALAAALKSDASGLSEPAAAAALARYGENRPQAQARRSAFVAFAARFRDPLVLLLVAAASSALTMFLVRTAKEGNR